MIDINMVRVATRMEFFKASNIPAKLAKKVSAPKSNSGIKDFGKLLTDAGDESVLMNKK